jgi:acyl-CoA synthetase (AMP-forming)/AMP-acid ligase II
MSTTDLSHNAKGARSQPSGRGHRVSASAENGTTNAAPTPIDDTNTTHLKDQLPWAPVLLNPQRLASAAIGALRGGANYASQLASIVTGGSPIGPKKGDRRFVCSVFFCGNPLTPVRLGQIAGQSLGVNAQSWDATRRPQINMVGEMMVTTPMPSMPLQLWNDPSGERYRNSYFDKHPTVWGQGDWISITEYGGVEVKGRSDATLNRGGVRLGSAEIYTVVDKFDEIRDSLVVGAELKAGRYLLALFVVLTDGADLDATLRGHINARLRAELSPRHVPDIIAVAPVVPRTLTGKKLEVPIKAILQGAPPASVGAPGAVDHPQALRWFAQWAANNGVSA